MLMQRTGSASRVVAKVIPSGPQKMKANVTTTDFNPVHDQLDEGTVIERWVPQDVTGVNRMNRLIFHRDAVCGPVTEMFAELPWSDFDLLGVKDKKVLQAYQDSLANLRFEEFLPDATKEYLAIGRLAGGLVFGDSTGCWEDVFVYDPDFLKITNRFMRNVDPKIDFKPTQALVDLLQSTDERDIDVIDRLPEHVRDNIKKADWIPLDPATTIFIPRRGGANDFIGTTIYTRAIPAWALEKQLLSGMAVGLKRRMGGITLVTVGNESWEASDAEMNAIANSFHNADADPVGAVIVLRQGSDVNRLDSNSSMWKLSDEFDFLSNWKMRAMGVSESLMGGEARIETAETARSAFTDRLRALRDHLTRKLIVDRVLLPLAKVHGFKQRKKADADGRIRIASPREDSEYIVPTIRWQKSLEPVSDAQWIDLLSTFEEKGGYVPISLWANAVGVNVSRIEEMAHNDKYLRGKFKKMKENAGVEETPEEGGDEAGLPGIGARVTSARGLDDLAAWRDNRLLGVGRNVVTADLNRVLEAMPESNAGPTATKSAIRKGIPAGSPNASRRRSAVQYALQRMGVASGPIRQNHATELLIDAMSNRPSIRKMQDETLVLNRSIDRKRGARELEQVDQIAQHIAGSGPHMPV